MRRLLLAALLATPLVFASTADAGPLTWYLKNSHSGGSADIAFSYGQAGDVPITGDWNYGSYGSDNIDTPAVFRNGSWYVRNSNSAGPHNWLVSFGMAGDTPFAGRWFDGNFDQLGIFRNGRWFHQATYAATDDGAIQGHETWAADHGGGSPGEIPVVLDEQWTRRAVFRSGIWHLDGFAGIPDWTYGYGMPGDIALWGNWDGIGLGGGPGIYRPSTREFFLNNSMDGQHDTTFQYGMPGDIPVVGDWNGDGIDTVGVVRPS